MEFNRMRFRKSEKDEVDPEKIAAAEKFEILGKVENLVDKRQAETTKEKRN